MNTTQPHLWQRQPGEAAADFTAFIVYLRLKGRRSLRAVATRTGFSLTAIRRLSSTLNWPGRVLAFEEHLAEATQRAVDSVLQADLAAEKSRLEKLRADEARIAQEILEASGRWLDLATNPRRRSVSLPQVLRLVQLASRLGRLALGLPGGDQKSRMDVDPKPPGGWDGPSIAEVEAKIEKIYGPGSTVPPLTKPPTPNAQSASDMHLTN